MSVSVEQVRYMARLARLRFTDEEERRLAADMSKILAYMDQLKQLDTEGVPPMSHVLDLYNVEREDRAMTRITREEALANAPDATDAFFRVPRVIE
ncbi:MAG: aspartyl/glutamyl-tRNA(Asn/Gln) amidotransferase subunit C [Rhodothermaceae bacterium]|nr:MAG: Asp-tRNA(Asn)/Glu-tRNA(Gln) amidotransferase subunit GatC [Bacteroidota bacterium]GIV62652.1 MAG: aspartyl/glutamyl-tRNA(Asn/Gln) amidotransferase subunit C [Rhodothermaceae bacterium]